MGKTSIEWTDHSINPIRAHDPKTGAVGHYCERISPGCGHCYASSLQKRFRLPAFPGASKTGGVKGGLEVFLDESKLQDVIRRRKPTQFFWCDMTDMFGAWVPDEWIDKCFAAMALSPQHTHQVLTKRPERMAEYMTRSHGLMGLGFDDGRDFEFESSAPARVLSRAAQFGLNPGQFTWPLPNVWLGVSVENQQYADERIPHLLRTPAAVRFLSCEPLLGALNLRLGWDNWVCSNCGFVGTEKDEIGMGRCPCGHELDNREDCGIDWVIGGGESGPNARPMHPDWVRSIRDQCQAAGVPFFFKQWGEWNPIRVDNDRIILHGIGSGDGLSRNGKVLALTHAENRRVFKRVGKKAAGRLLDGREWSEFPKGGAECHR